MIRQERIPIRAALWEVPAGQIDEGAAIEDVALRELREETGYELGPGGELLPLGHFFSSPGFTDEHSYFFLARGVRPANGGHAHEEAETILDCRAFALSDVTRMIAGNEIRDANTLSVYAKLRASGLVNLRD
jgi:ADP-ribose pyrophosphatase